MKKTGESILVDCSFYDLLEVGKPLPTARAFCKYCADDIAKPIGFVSFNGKLGIVLECEKCHSRYVMYEHAYKSRYEGVHTKYGFIPPTYGNLSQKPPRSVQDKMNADRDIRKKQSDENLAKTFGITVSELEEKRKKWKEEDAKAYKRFEQERAEKRLELKDREIKQKSEERKQLIADGVLVWSNSQKCLIDTRTNTPYKL